MVTLADEKVRLVTCLCVDKELIRFHGRRNTFPTAERLGYDGGKLGLGDEIGHDGDHV